MFYAIAPNGDVRSFKSKTIAQSAATETGGYFASDATPTDTGLTQVPTPMLVTLHNAIRPEKPVTRFADRKTGETRLKGVLEVLAKPGEAPAVIGAIEPSAPAIGAEDAEEEYTNDPSLSEEENNVARAAKKSARKGAAKKSTAKKGATRSAAPSISDATVRKVIKMRADGKGWPEILKELGEKSNNFIHRIRPLMKAMDKGSVRLVGPGSPNYGKGAAKKATKRAAKKTSR
jgi:cell pole-organizing protein PopZ